MYLEHRRRCDQVINDRILVSIGRCDDLKVWMLASYLQEWVDRHPGGKFDPTEDRAPRTRKLANRWRTTVGLPILE